MNRADLKAFLNEKVVLYNTPKFIETDPIQIPHNYSLKEDIEISGFLTATIAWGNRKMIIKNADKMMELMGNSPYDFVMNHNEHHLSNFNGFVHRTFNSKDFSYFIKALKHIYTNHDGLENIFKTYGTADSLQPAIHQLKKVFFEIYHPVRTTKHMSDPMKGSASNSCSTSSILVTKSCQPDHVSPFPIGKKVTNGSNKLAHHTQ